MRTDARGIFVVALLIFLATTGWILWMALQPPPAPPPAPPPEPVKLAPFRPLGVIGLVSNQFAAQALVVPVNPFRPTFEMMIRHPESGDLVSLAAATSRGSGGVSLAAATSRGSGGVSQPGDPARIRRPVAGATEEDGPPPVPKYSFGGIMQRPDGRVAAYLKNSLGGGRFLVKGDEFAGCRVLDATADGIVLRQPDGTTRSLARNDPPVELGGN